MSHWFANTLKTEPRDDEPVRDFVHRVYRERGFLIQSAGLLRATNAFHEVETNLVDPDVETWLFENIKDDNRYYYIDGVWFFNDPEAAAIFKLAYGKVD